MAVSSKKRKSDETLEDQIRSIDEETFLKNLSSFPYLFKNKAVVERLRAISHQWKEKIESKKIRRTQWESTLYLVHLCVRLLDVPEFKWLKEKFYTILMMRPWSSETDSDYWEALKGVRRDFTVTKPKVPEKKWIVARRYEYHRNEWILREMSEIIDNLLSTLKIGRVEREERIRELSRRIKVPSITVEVEIERLARLCDKEVRGPQELMVLSSMLVTDLNREEESEDRERGIEFWKKIFKPAEKKMKQFKGSLMEKVSNEMGLSKETVRKLLKKAGPGVLLRF